MVSQSDGSDLDRDVDESMRMFEKSKIGSAVAITPIKPSRVLLVLDGSPQDETAVDAARWLHERFDTETLVLDAREVTDAMTEDTASTRAGEIMGARPLPRGDGESYDVILAAIGRHDADMVILPCPFGRSFQHVGTDSAGTVIDVLLARCPKPLLVIRRDDQKLSAGADRVSVIVGGECDVEGRAAAWAFGLANPNATLTLNLVIEKEQFENIRSILEALQPDAVLDSHQFSDALTKAHQAIHASMAKTASSLGMTYHLRPQAGEVAPPNPLNESRLMLLVLPLEVDDRFSQGFVQDRIRRSPHPVLIVPGHVQTDA